MVSITQAAKDKLAEVAEDDSAVRVDVVRGPHGCIHGWRLAIEDAPRPDDVILPAGEIRVLCDPQVAELLDGATIDYREDATGIGFSVDAPAAGHDHGGGGCQHGH